MLDAAGSEIMSFMLSNVSPRMGIMTIRNENEATFSRLSPRSIPVAMVVPERLRPGRTAIDCAMPMTNASSQVMSRGRYMRPVSLLVSSGFVRKK